jgi:hypothetical protein
VDLEQLDQARDAARAVLGDRIYDIAYRASEAYLADRDPEWEPQDGPLPATQPPARWWLIERPARPGASTFEPPVSVAYEDEYGTWWEHDPDTGRLHEAPWLFTEYYYRPGACGHHFTPLVPEEARQRIASGLPPFGDGRSRPTDGEDSLDPEVALRASSGGSARR